MRRARVAAGLLLVASASFLALEPASRGTRLLDAVADLWPYALAALAVSAAAAAIVEPRRLTGPLVLGLVAVAGLSLRHERFAAVVSAWWPAVAVTLGVGIAIARPSVGSGRRIVAVGWTVRRSIHDEMPDTLAVTCVLGGAHLDLRDAALAREVTLIARAVLGFVKVEVPRHWPVLLDGLPSPLVTLDERGRRDTVDVAGSAVLRLRLDGVVGTVVVERW
jgi:hypothetical protein